MRSGNAIQVCTPESFSEISGKTLSVSKTSKVSHWGVSVEPQLICFSLYFYSKWGGMVGKRAVKSWFIIEFIVARLPTLQIWGEKKVAKIPEI